MSLQALGEHGGKLLGLWCSGVLDVFESWRPQSSRRERIRSDCDSLMVLAARSQTKRCPRYLVLLTGPSEINSIDFEISCTNQS